MAEYEVIENAITLLKEQLKDFGTILSKEAYEKYLKEIEEIEEEAIDLPSRNPMATSPILDKIVALEMNDFFSADVAKQAKLRRMDGYLEYILKLTQQGIDTSEMVRKQEKCWEKIKDNYNAIVQNKQKARIDTIKLDATLNKIRLTGMINMDEIRIDQNYSVIKDRLLQMESEETTNEATKQLINGWLIEIIEKTGIDEKAMEELIKNPQLWRVLSGVQEKQPSKEDYVLDEFGKEGVESEARRREIKEVCLRYGIDESEVQEVLDGSTNNVYIVKKIFGGYEVVSRGDSGYSKAKAVIYNNSRTELPEDIKGFYPEIVILSDNLEAIPPRMFYKNKKLTSIRLPKKLKLIGYGAFRDSGLESIEIPDSVEKIGEYAFYRSCLKSLKLGKGIKHIMWGTFAKCNLEIVDIPGTVSKIDGRETIDDYDGDYTVDGAFSGNPLKKVNLHNGIDEIGEFAFEKTELESITIPPSVKDINKQFANTKTVVKRGVLASHTSNRETQVSKPLETIIVYGEDKDEHTLQENKAPNNSDKEEQPSLNDLMEEIKKLRAENKRLSAEVTQLKSKELQQQER